MLVLSVGGVFAAGDDGYYPADKNEEANGSTSSSVEAGGEAGGSVGPIIITVQCEIARFDDSALSLPRY